MSAEKSEREKIFSHAEPTNLVIKTRLSDSVSFQSSQSFKFSSSSSHSSSEIPTSIFDEFLFASRIVAGKVKHWNIIRDLGWLNSNSFSSFKFYYSLEQWVNRLLLSFLHLIHVSNMAEGGAHTNILPRRMGGGRIIFFWGRTWKTPILINEVLL